MIGTQTPFRMSFIGGGTDLKEFYSRHQGAVLSTTIDKYMYIFIHPFFDKQIQIKYSKTELVDRIDQIKHPIVREALKKFDLNGIDINSIADIPSGTGLGSSSTFTVGLLNALYLYTNKKVSRQLLAEEACEIEIQKLNEPIGKQDQYAAALGGLNIIRFNPNENVCIEPIAMKNKDYNKLQDNLLLFYTGKTRKASEVLEAQKSNLQNNNSKFESMIQMTELVEEAKNMLIQSDLTGFGRILDKNWKLKKTLANKISNTDIDDIYEHAKKNGATGGKLLGAGGGGFLLFYCDKKKQEELRNGLKQLQEVSFNFEAGGTKSIDFK